MPERDYQFYDRLRKLLRRPTVKTKVYADRPANRLESRIFGAFAKVASNQYMHSLAGSTERLARTRDYELMDISSAIISTALNIWADDATTYNEDGKVIKITSGDAEIKQHLYELFYDRLNIDYNLWHWMRNMCKYGDFFLMMDVLEDEGVTTFMPLPTVEIEREEAYDGDINSVRFKWNTASAVTFENWQIAHFRMIGDDTFLPYGKSFLESGRRIWKQLNLIEDAMLVYRIQRAPERRIFRIDVGNINPNDIPSYMQKAKDILKRSPLVQDDGKIDLRFNVHPVHKDTMIPLLDSRVITIENLAKEYDAGKQNWVYSIQDQSHKIVAGKVKWCGKNYTATKLIKVTLDDGGVVKTAPEHPFVLRDGSSMRADELQKNMSLMPMYKRLDSKGYEEIYSPEFDKFVKTHQAVAHDVFREEIFEVGQSNYCVHHKGIWENGLQTKRDNSPSNLQVMSKKEHWAMHSEKWTELNQLPDFKQKRIEELTKWNKSDRHRAITVATNKKYDLARKMGLMYNGTPELHKQHNAIRSETMKAMWADPEKRAATRANMKGSHKNHKIVNVEVINEIVDVYCMEVIGMYGENDRHNFMVQTNEMNGICLKNSQEEDYFLAVRGNDSGTDIRTLPGATNLGDIDDVRYVQNNLIAALGIPRAYLTFEEQLNSKTTLSQEDVRFARTIQRIQKLTISELNKIAMIHLYALGYTDTDDLTNFKIHLTNPSTVSDQMKLELLAARVTAYMSAVQSVGVDREWAQKHILKLSDNEIQQINKGVAKDSKFNAEVQVIAQQVQQANAPQQLPAPGGNGKAAQPLPPGQQPIDQIPGGQAVPAAPPTGSQQGSIFKNSPDNPMSMTNPKKKDVTEEDEIEKDRPDQVSDLFDPNNKEDVEIRQLAKKYDFLGKQLSERNKISRDVTSIFAKLDKKFNEKKKNGKDFS